MKTIATLLGIKNPWPTVERLYARADAEKNQIANKEIIKIYSDLLTAVITAFTAIIASLFIPFTLNSIILFMATIIIPINIYMDYLLKDIDKYMWPMTEAEKNYQKIQNVIREMQLRRE